MKPEDLEPYQRFQLEKYGDILPEANEPISETEEERRFSEWMQHEAEQQILEHE